jgi:hypothetical protein
MGSMDLARQQLCFRLGSEFKYGLWAHCLLLEPFSRPGLPRSRRRSGGYKELDVSGDVPSQSPMRKFFCSEKQLQLA